MRKLVTIDQVVDIRPIPDADFIEMAQVRNWQCVVKKSDNLKPGDLCVYAEIDSLFPLEPRWEFLNKNGVKSVEIEGTVYTGYRLRTMKLRGQIAQGLALPLSFFTENLPTEIGADITELLRVVKWEMPVGNCIGNSRPKGNFPAFIPKTDEERIQNIKLKNLVGKIWNGYEKLDGTSATYYNWEGEVGMCSRNWDLKVEPGSVYYDMLKKYDIENTLPDGYAIQCEIVGPGIQKNRQGFVDKQLRLFRVFDIAKQCFIPYDNLLWLNTIPKVYLIHSNLVTTEFNTIEDYFMLLECLAPNQEGIVFYTYDPSLPFGKDSFKIINNAYLLKNKD